MIGNNEQLNDTNSNLIRIKLITSKRKSLEDNSIQVKEEIKNCFAELTEALRSREKQLLRQAEAIYSQQLSLIQSNFEFLPPSIVILNEKQNLKDQIYRFGQIELSDTNSITLKDVEPYKLEEYEEAHKDHVSFDKSIKHENDIHVQVNQLEQCEIYKLNTNCKISNRNVVSDSNLILSIIKDTNTMQELPALKNKDECTDVKIKSILDTLSDSHLLKNSSNIQTVIVRDSATNSFPKNKEGVEKEEHDSSDTCINILSCKVHNNSQNQSFCNEDVVAEETQNQEILKDSYKPPQQVQQWLQQILMEIELEPNIHEVGQFSEIAQARFHNEYQLKT